MNEFDKQNQKLWKWGIIYVNPNDPLMWVEKRNGLGWTLNFAHSKSYLIVGVFLLTLAALIFLLNKL